MDTNKYLFCSGISHWETNPYYTTLLNNIDNWLYYVAPDNNLVLSSSGKFPPVSGDYLIPEASIQNIGDNAPFDRNFTINSSINNQIIVYSYFTGQANEMRRIDDAIGTFDIWHNNQVVYYGTIQNNPINIFGSSPGIYSVILKNRNYSLFDNPGTQETNLTFELGNYDPDPPRLTSLQILMNDRISIQVISGNTATVNFSAGDWINSPTQSSTEYNNLKYVHLRYKSFIDSIWQELPIQAQTANLDSLFGMPYVADLEPVINQYNDFTLIDLGIELIDSAGNSNAQTICPAFVVRDGITGTRSVIGDHPFMVYNDQFTNRIILLGCKEPFVVSVYSLTGQFVKESKDQHEIDVSGLVRGLYILRFNNLNTGEIYCRKFIR